MEDKNVKEIEYVVGDATSPNGDGMKVICHCVNSFGLWGKGFVLALSKKNTNPEAMYRHWYKRGAYRSVLTGVNAVPFKLGKVQIALFSGSTVVCNIIGQEGIHSVNGVPPIRYEAIRSGFEMMRKLLEGKEYSVHMPRIGCGLAGGEWSKVEEIIKETLCNYGISVTVYDFKEK